MFICEECYDDKVEDFCINPQINVNEILRFKIIDDVSSIISISNGIMNNIYKNKYNNIDPYCDEILYPQLYNNKIYNCMDPLLLSQRQCIEFCRLPKTVLKDIAERSKSTFLKVFVFFFYWAHDMSTNIIAIMLGRHQTTICRYINEATDDIYDNFIGPYFAD